MRNPLDVLAQQMVAVVAAPAQAQGQGSGDQDGEGSGGISYAELLRVVRGAAGFAGLSNAVFDGVLDMLAGRASER